MSVSTLTNEIVDRLSSAIFHSSVGRTSLRKLLVHLATFFHVCQSSLVIVLLWQDTSIDLLFPSPLSFFGSPSFQTSFATRIMSLVDELEANVFPHLMLISEIIEPYKQVLKLQRLMKNSYRSFFRFLSHLPASGHYGVFFPSISCSSRRSQGPSA